MYMSKKETIPDPSTLGDEALIDILFWQKDRVSRAVIDEILNRRERMGDAIAALIMNDHSWHHDADEWVPRHATYILGAIGGRDVVIPLMRSLRSAAEYDDEWILDELPSIFGALGDFVYEPLRAMVLDRSNDWIVRSTALDGLAAITIKNPARERAVFDLAASIMNDISEEDDMRGLSGLLLLDFMQKTYEKSLRAFIEYQEAQKEKDPFYMMHFDDTEIAHMITADDHRHVEHYTHDWLRFYDPEAFAARERIRRENRGWWWRRYFLWWKFRARFKNILEPL